MDFGHFKIPVNKVQNETNKIIQDAKDKYHYDLGDKLCDARNGQKVIWTAFKRLLNKKKCSNIPPLLEDNKFVSNFFPPKQVSSTRISRNNAHHCLLTVSSRILIIKQTTNFTTFKLPKVKL